MLDNRLRAIVGPAAVVGLLVGCDTSRPGEGFTNGPAPIYAPENPAVRTDLPPPDRPDADTLGDQARTGPESAGTGSQSPSPAGSEPTPPPAAPKVNEKR